MNTFSAPVAIRSFAFSWLSGLDTQNLILPFATLLLMVFSIFFSPLLSLIPLNSLAFARAISKSGMDALSGILSSAIIVCKRIWSGVCKNIYI